MSYRLWLKTQENCTRLTSAVACGGLTEVKKLLADPSLCIDEEAHCLDLAVNKKNPEMVLLLIDRGIGDEVSIESALLWAARKGNVDLVDQILAKCPALIARDSPYTILDEAVRDKRFALVTQLLALDLVDSYEEGTVLHSAARSGSIEMIDYLLEREPRLSDKLDISGYNALHVAAVQGHSEVFFKLLAQNPRSIDVISSQRENTLNFAVRGGVPQVLEAILSLRPEFVGWVDMSRNTILHHVCQARGKTNQARLEPYLERIWQLNPSALHAANEFKETPLICSASSTPEWGTELFKRKLSWDELIQGIDRSSTDPHSSLPEKAQISRVFAEEQCELGLSSVLFIPDVIAMVKEYFFAKAGSPWEGEGEDANAQEPQSPPSALSTETRENPVSFHAFTTLSG